MGSEGFLFIKNKIITNSFELKKKKKISWPVFQYSTSIKDWFYLSFFSVNHSFIESGISLENTWVSTTVAFLTSTHHLDVGNIFRVVKTLKTEAHVISFATTESFGGMAKKMYCYILLGGSFRDLVYIIVSKHINERPNVYF